MQGGGVAFAEQDTRQASSSLRARLTRARRAGRTLAREKTGISSSTSTFSIGCRPSRSRACRRRTHDVLHHALPLAPFGVHELPEDAFHELGALRQQPEERLEPNREADRDAGRARRRLLRRALEHLVEPDGGRRGDRPACPIRTSRARCRRAGTRGPWSGGPTRRACGRSRGAPAGPFAATRNISSVDVNRKSGRRRSRSTSSTAGSGSSHREARASADRRRPASAHDAASKT